MGEDNGVVAAAERAVARRVAALVEVAGGTRRWSDEDAKEWSDGGGGGGATVDRGLAEFTEEPPVGSGGKEGGQEGLALPPVAQDEEPDEEPPLEGPRAAIAQASDRLVAFMDVNRVVVRGTGVVLMVGGAWWLSRGLVRRYGSLKDVPAGVKSLRGQAVLVRRTGRIELFHEPPVLRMADWLRGKPAVRPEMMNTIPVDLAGVVVRPAGVDWMRDKVMGAHVRIDVVHQDSDAIKARVFCRTSLFGSRDLARQMASQGMVELDRFSRPYWRLDDKHAKALERALRRHKRWKRVRSVGRFVRRVATTLTWPMRRGR